MRRWLLAVMVVVAACSPEPPAAPPAAAGDTPEALNWSAELVGGGQLDGGELAGRDVVLWFWAPF